MWQPANREGLPRRSRPCGMGNVAARVLNLSRVLVPLAGVFLSPGVHQAQAGGPGTQGEAGGTIGREGLVPGYGNRASSAETLNTTGLGRNAASVVRRQTDSHEGDSIVAWGWSNVNQCAVPPPNRNFTMVAGGLWHSLGLKTDGSIVAWGSNTDGKCDVPTPNTGFVAVAAGRDHSLGLRATGVIEAWGDNTYGQCGNWGTGYVAIAAGSFHSLGLWSTGVIEARGDNTFGQCNVGGTGFVAVAAGLRHSVGLKSDGSIEVWGQSDPPPPPNTDFVAVAAGVFGHNLGLKADGSIVAWGNNGSGQCDVPEPNTDFLAVAAGALSSLGLKADGSIVTWGDCNYSVCEVPSPNMGFVAVASGWYHSFGLRDVRLIVSLDESRTGDGREPGGGRFLTSGAMATATQVLWDAGFSITTTSDFILENILDASVLYTGLVDVGFSAQEMADIEQYVFHGGGLVIQRDHTDLYPAADDLAVLFGAEYDWGPYGDGVPCERTPIAQVVTHPIWHGPAGAVTSYDQIWFSGVLGGDPIGTASGVVALAVRSYGAGRVVFLTDIAAWDDIDTCDEQLTPVPGSSNGIVWENIFHWADGRHSGASFSSWINPAGGDFEWSDNWSDDVPGAGNTAVFDLHSGGYIVQLNDDATNGGLRVGDDTVTLDLNTAAYSIGGNWDGVLVGYRDGDRAALTLTGEGGVLSVSADAVIGVCGDDTGSAVGEMYVVGPGISWEVRNMAIGYGLGAQGALTVTDAATLHLFGTIPNAAFIIGYGPSDWLTRTKRGSSEGSVTVSGAGSSLILDSWFFVGRNGTGTLRIEEGGEILAIDCHIAQGPGSIGSATVTGTGSRMTIAAVGYITVGRIGHGTLRIEAGGEVSHQARDAVVVVGVFDGAVGELTVTGVNSKLKTPNAGIYVGYFRGAQGTMLVQDGGYVLSGAWPYGAGVIGHQAGAVGEVLISGPGSLWEANGSLNVGYEGSGALTLSDGGRINSEGAFIGRLGNSSGEVTVSGSGSLWTSTGDFVVGSQPFEAIPADDPLLWTRTGDFVIEGDGPGTPTGAHGERGGFGTLTVADEARVTAPVILILAHGEVTGTGQLQGPVSNSGLVAPGLPVGTLHIDGDYGQLATGRLNVELGGMVPGGEHDVVSVTGAVHLGGELHIELIDEFVPEVGQQFTILTAGSVTGGFLTVTGQGGFSVTYNSDDVTLTALPPDAHMTGAVPVDQESLWRSANNVIRLMFDGDIAAPQAGELLLQELGTNGTFEADLSTNFSSTVESVDVGGVQRPRVLKVTENGSWLTSRTWIGIRNVGGAEGWTGVAPFEIQYVVQVGDVNADGKVLANDLSAIFPKIPTNPAGDQERADVNGDSKVLANDLSAVFPRIPSNTVPKPSGH